ncbi:MAG: enoyl-CoA hydratase [Candidatus Eremiobacteraeota bacterium]|nr:enoyl-CoA hydratase [Candidatus Eremiobacteraeota bacterium]
MIQATDFTSLRYEASEGIASIAMTRSEKRNALSLDMMRELMRAFTQAGADSANRAIVLSGEGPAFSAGHDLSELIGRDVSEYREIFDTCVELMQLIQSIPVPVIAQVDGIATAAGCQLVATCDLAFASTQARFATPGVKIGLFCTTPMVALTRAIGPKRAMQMLLTGEFVDARTALDWGLVNAVCEPENLREEVLSLARKLAAPSRRIVGLGKAAFYAQIGLEQADAYVYAKEVMSQNAVASDAQEGMSAFLHKRPPKWTP